MTPPRRLHFAVGTGLLTLGASLAIGCTPKRVNEGPQEPPHVNEGPVDEFEDADAGSVDEEPAEAPPAEAPPAELEEPAYVNTQHVPDRR